MSNPIVATHAGAIARVTGMINQFIEECPEELWNTHFGGWPIWQQIYHTLAAVGYFVFDEDETLAQYPVPFSEDIAWLTVVASTSCSKSVMKEFAAQMQAHADKYIASLDDTMLTEKNKGFSLRRKTECNHTITLVMLAAHAFYHLGSCDAILRENGLKGIF